MRPFLLLFLLGAGVVCAAQPASIRVYFNRSVDTSVSTGVNAISLYQATDDTIEAYIDRAQYGIDVAMYNADDYSIMHALNDAHDRGVQVRYIAEGTNTNAGLAELDSAIPVLFRTDGEGSGMHNKFMSIDADHADRAWVWTGSVNWTQNGLFDDYNNMVFIHHQGMAQAYRTEFEEMWGGSGAQPVVANSRFGADKTDSTVHTFNVDGVTVQCYFSPSDHTTSHIVNAIDGADHSLYAALFAFTNDDIGSAMAAAAERPGVWVSIDLEDAIYSGTEGWYVWTNGVSVATHQGDDVLLHHKYGVIDEGTTDDPSVITGSHNWTWYAETVNDENAIIIHDATVANLFYQEWHARHAEVAAVEEHAATASFDAWPVPAGNELHVRLPGSMRAAELSVIDAYGRVVLRDRTVALDRTFDLTDLSDGVYVVMSEQGDRRTQRMITVAR